MDEISVVLVKNKWLKTASLVLLNCKVDGLNKSQWVIIWALISVGPLQNMHFNCPHVWVKL